MRQRHRGQRVGVGDEGQTGTLGHNLGGLFIGVWHGVAVDSLKFHPGPPCPTLLCPVDGPVLERPYNRFRDGPLAKRVACGRLLPLWTPDAVRL
jgi:hypothetical protein